MMDWLNVRAKPELYGGAAFGVAWKDLMPSLRNAWNNEAYDEDRRVNRKVYEKSAMSLAASDQSTPIPPLRLRAVLTEATSALNSIAEHAQQAAGSLDQDQPADLSAMISEWNALVAKINPLVIGPVNVGMSDEDTNALHNLVSNTLLQPLENLQAIAGEPGKAQLLIGDYAILSDDIAKNILLQVRAKYYKAIPYAEGRRAAPSMMPPPAEMPVVPERVKYESGRLAPAGEMGFAALVDAFARALAEEGEKQLPKQIDEAATRVQKAFRAYKARRSVESLLKMRDGLEDVLNISEDVDMRTPSGSAIQQRLSQSAERAFQEIQDLIDELQGHSQMSSVSTDPSILNVTEGTPFARRLALVSNPNMYSVSPAQGAVARQQSPQIRLPISPAVASPSKALRLPSRESPGGAVRPPKEQSPNPFLQTPTPTPPKAVSAAPPAPQPPKAPRETPEYQEWEQRRKAFPAVGQRNKKQQEQYTNLMEEGIAKGYVVRSSRPKKKEGKGRWTDYTGPIVFNQNPMRGSGAPYRDTPQGNTGNRSLRTVADPLDFNDEENDPNELGDVAIKDEMIGGEMREAHLDPDWKGLPKRWGIERRIPKLRKGYINPKEKY